HHRHRRRGARLLPSALDAVLAAAVARRAVHPREDEVARRRPLQPAEELQHVEDVVHAGEEVLAGSGVEGQVRQGDVLEEPDRPRVQRRPVQPDQGAARADPQQAVRLVRDADARHHQAAVGHAGEAGSFGDQAAAPHAEEEPGDDRLGLEPDEELLLRQEDQVPARLRAEPGSVRVDHDDERDHDGLGRALVELQELTERLRRECPWDREQTARTIVPHTVEEAYEVADAALAGDDPKLLDELGDLLFQCVFLALLLRERDRGDLEQVITRVHDKRVQRHPHVFGDEALRTAGSVRSRWEELKREQEGREGIFHDVPENLPALLYARKLQRRATSVGFEYPDLAGAVADLDDELRELREELPATEPVPEREPPPRVAAELGDVLFALVNVARRLNVDPELELRAAAKRFRMRVERADDLAAGDGSDWKTLPLSEQDAYYDRAKEEEAGT